MITIRRQLLGLGFVAASSLLALHTAHAMSGPTAITIDGGPLGSLSLSGGVDGYGYYQSNTGTGIQNNGANIANGLVELQKTSGVLQFTLELGSNGGAIAIGSNTGFVGGYYNNRLPQTSITNFATGPLYAGYITVAPANLPVTFSAGILPSLEGYESGVDWINPSQLVTSIYYVQNSQARGVQAALTEGPLTATVQFGDGFDTGVFNFVQALASYTIDSSNIASVYYAGNLGRTGLNAKTYSGDCSFGSTAPGCYGTVGSYGAYYINSQMIGGYYSYTMGNLNIVPEVQYVFAKADQQLGLTKSSYNAAAAVFGDYTFANTPYSVGGWVSFEDSNGYDSWYAGPKSEAVSTAVSPTWQYKDLFARANAGATYLLNNKAFSTASYGSNGTDKFQFTGTLEAGLLF
jgi:hypothetical protein